MGAWGDDDAGAVTRRPEDEAVGRAFENIFPTVIVACLLDEDSHEIMHRQTPWLIPGRPRLQGRDAWYGIRRTREFHCP